MIDLSTSTDPDIGVAGRVLAVLDVAAKSVGVDYLVVGATARNVLSMAWFDRLPPRATRDVDVAVAVPDWSAFRRLTAGLTPRGGAHAFTVSLAGSPVEVDIVPYGGVEEPDRTVHLPDDHNLNVLGIQEVFDAAVTAQLPAGAEVRVPTIPGLALLKIITWRDRRLLSRRDATDLDEIISWYAEGPFLDQLYDEVDILGKYDFDVALAAAHRLGRQIGLLAGRECTAAVLAILGDDELRVRLANDMGRPPTADPTRLWALANGVADTDPTDIAR
jgi:predicted nucleotidyltransferase